MKLILDSNHMRDYLQNTHLINYDEDSIKILANQIREKSLTQLECITKVYEYVRDNISHSADSNCIRITFIASDVLEEKQASVLLNLIINCGASIFRNTNRVMLSKGNTR